MRLVLSLTLIAAVACRTADDDIDDTDGAPTDDTDPASSDPTLAGVWEAEDLDVGVFDANGPSRVRFVSLEARDGSASGSVSFYGVDDGSGILDCFDGIYAATDAGVLTIASSALGGYADFASSLFLVSWEDEDRIELTDDRGITQRFDRADEVDDDFVCGDVTIEQSERFEFRARYSSNLFFDGTDLRLMADDETVAYRIDLELGEIDEGDGVTYGYSGAYVATAENSDTIWGTCNCGGNEEIVRDPGSAGSTSTYEFMDDGDRVSVEAAAFDGTDLWVYGYSAAGRSLLRHVDADTFDTVAEVEVTWDAQQLTFHDGVLYGVDGETVFALDTETGLATGTWVVPSSPDVYGWRGLASDGTALWLYALSDVRREVELAQVSLD